MKRFVFLCTLIGLTAIPTNQFLGQQTSEAGAQPSEARDTNAPQPATSSNEKLPTEVIFLKHEKADDVAKVLRQIYSGVSDATFVPDDRLNAVIVAGPSRIMAEIRKVVEALDRSKDPSSSPVVAVRVHSKVVEALDPSKDPSRNKFHAAVQLSDTFPASPDNPNANGVVTQDLRKQYEAKERQSLELAQQLRQVQPNTLNDAQRFNQLKAQLRQVVAEAFTMRRRVQQAELAEFQQRLLRTQVTLELRNRIQDQIIDRRVEDLLNPSLTWDLPADAPVPPPGANVGPDRDDYRSNVPAQSPRAPSAFDLTTPAAAIEELQQLIRLAEQERDHTRVMYQGGKTPLSELLTADQKLVERHIRLAEATGKWEEAAAKAEELVKIRQQAVAEIKTRFDQGVVSTVEVFRTESALLEAQAQLRSLTQRAANPPSAPSAPSDPSSRLRPTNKKLSDDATRVPLGAFLNKSPSDYAQSVHKVRSEIASYEKGISDIGPEHPNAKLIQPELAALKQQLEILMLEFRTQVQLAEGQLRAAEDEYVRTKNELARASQLEKGKQISMSELQSVVGRTEQSARLLDQAKAMLRLYRDSEQTLFGEQPALKPAPDDVLRQLKLEEQKLLRRYGREHPKVKEVVDRIQKAEKEVNKFSEDDAQTILWDELGIRVKEVGPPQEMNPRGPYRGGLRIVELRSISPAERNGMQVNDILVGLDRWETVTLKNAVYALRNSPSGSGNPDNLARRITFHILRNNGPTVTGFVQLSP